MSALPQVNGFGTPSEARRLLHREQRMRVSRRKRPTPKHPTKAMPGTKDKVEEMRGRMERGEELYHPEDAGYSELD